MNPEILISAASAKLIPAGESGPWTIKKFMTNKPFLHTNQEGKTETIPPGFWTNLWRKTDATMHLDGELVMNDIPSELKKHLIFMLRARGKVLITGLGLGCVVRGTLANPAVEHITVIERDHHVLKLVGPHMPRTDRLTLIKADAVEFAAETTDTFDCAWHDLWTDRAAGEPHLQLRHSEVMGKLIDKVHFQGAWEFPRHQRRLWQPLRVI